MYDWVCVCAAASFNTNLSDIIPSHTNIISNDYQASESAANIATRNLYDGVLPDVPEGIRPVTPMDKAKDLTLYDYAIE